MGQCSSYPHLIDQICFPQNFLLIDLKVEKYNSEAIFFILNKLFSKKSIF